MILLARFEGSFKKDHNREKERDWREGGNNDNDDNDVYNSVYFE